MNKLPIKLTLAFLLVGLTGALLVAVIIRQRTSVAFNQFILNRDQQTLVNNLVQYYQDHGSWEGLADNMRSILDTTPPSIDNGPGFRREPMPLTVVGPGQTVVFSPKPEQIGQQFPSRELNRAIALKSGSETIGWLLLSPSFPQVSPDSPEARFLKNVTSAALLSALVATALALTLGGLLAFTLTRSLRELTDATVEIARGKLGLQVKVRSKDELGELAASFNKMSLDLERATQARRLMTADIAHDLRSPLSVISGYAEALSDGKLPGTPETYDILYQETRHLSRLVEDLRLLSLADAGELALTLQPTDPQRILERVAARHAVAAQRNGISLRVNAEQDLPPVVVDLERMAQVLDNLVHNAFRYTPQGGEVVLAARAVNGTVQLRVQDNGSGITPEDLPHIFDRFYRGDKARQQTGESGLGLAIAKSIVEAHGGTIAAENTPGQGAAFTITLEAKSL